jgi:rod shape-determining protein MreD
MTRIHWSILLLVTVLLQRTFLGHLVAINDVAPDMLLVALAFYALRFGRIDGVIAGFLCGLLFDSLGTGIFGLSALTKSIAGFAFGSFTLKILQKHIWNFPLLIAVTVLLHDVIYQYVARFVEDVDLLTMIFRHTLPATVYTVLVGELVYLVVIRRTKG